ncbi:aromatic amino acid transaminase [Candidatus Vallotia tarda]|uniref:Aromatic-amino-acid aminotransferase n=1 Tax=Candidatus Vallotiella hemipterorum TaxID=1177213 RepID=A0A8E4H486_9BURK|nr:amino acid aminotransferase [Candidatus Vallotia tarda]CAD6506654.1 Aromatic-amino-acid aminotransferase [Candidatus Vallotia tarda]CAG7605179.1 Aromatic-amino-acid aminotransferase [Candidatus Vallotia tarda]
MFEHVKAFPGDPILSLNEDFQDDPRVNKVNLSIGIYFDAYGKLPVMAAVRDAEHALARETRPRPYLPMAGLPDYRDAVYQLVFGNVCGVHTERRIATLQTLGGSGALKVGADFLRRTLPNAQVWISDPSWENHRVVFERAGFTVNTYPYYDSATGGVRFTAMLDALRAISNRHIVLLHACCHNPTGVDLDHHQWREVISLIEKKELLPFIDMAYQGFGTDLDDDAFAVRELTARGISCLVANSFSKNFALYGERCGGLSVVCQSNEEATRVLGQLTGAVRSNYSNPPTYGAKVVHRVLCTPILRTLWQSELASMCKRIAAMRHAIYERLKDRRIEDSLLSCYVRQRGMFTYTGFSSTQVDRLRTEHGVYLVRSGRMCIAGLNEQNIDVVADAIARVLLV